MRELTQTELTELDSALNGALGPTLQRFLFDKSLGRNVENAAGVAEAVRLGLADESGRLTEFGNLVKDPVREFMFFRERGFTLPSQKESSLLLPARFRGKRVLELGSGAGCNLLSLGSEPAFVVGVEPMPVYAQLSAVLARAEGFSPPLTVVGSAENIPFPDGNFDVVLCYSSLQYMDQAKAVSEIARVLRPGGKFIAIGNTLLPFVTESVERFWHTRSLGALKYDALAIVNTLSTQLRGRRTVTGKGRTTTETPIYTSLHFLRRLLAANRLLVAEHEVKFLPSGETLLSVVRV